MTDAGNGMVDLNHRPAGKRCFFNHHNLPVRALCTLLQKGHPAAGWMV